MNEKRLLADWKLRGDSQVSHLQRRMLGADRVCGGDDYVS